ncbi:LOW QUALITY PROTEIN: uncharacterized protein ACR2FA_008699 [Aphomia sociella]
MILGQVRHDYNELQYYNQLLLNQHFGTRARIRRGLINAFGSIANTLFGVLDESLAEKYNINKLIQNKEDHITQLWKNQTSIIEAEYNILKRTEETIDEQHKIINRHLNYLVLTPQQLSYELQIIANQISKELTLPIESIQSNLYSVYKLLKIKARMTEEYLIFEITLPLINRDNFQLYRLIPVPYQIGQSMVTIQSIAECKNIWIQLHDPSTYFYFCCDTYSVRIIYDEEIQAREVSKGSSLSVSARDHSVTKRWSILRLKKRDNSTSPISKRRVPVALRLENPSPGLKTRSALSFLGGSNRSVARDAAENPEKGNLKGETSAAQRRAQTLRSTEGARAQFEALEKKCQEIQSELDLAAITEKSRTPTTQTQVQE